MLAKVDTDKNQSVAAKYGIRGIPNCKLFYKGEVINEFTGALPEHTVKDWLKKSIPGKFADKIEKAKRLLIEGKEIDAKVLLEEIYSVEPGNTEVKVLLAKILLFDNPKVALKLIDPVEVSTENTELTESIKLIGELFEKESNPDELPESPTKENYLNAIKELKSKNFDSSLKLFIDTIRNDRQYDDDGSRKACIAIFKYLGEDHETTLEFRKDFGSALYI